MWQALLVSMVALWLVVIFEGLVLVGLIRALARRDGGPDPADDDGARWGAPEMGALTGRPAPTLPATDAAGRPVHRDGRARVVLFISPGCRQCEPVLHSVESVAALFGAAADAVILVCAATADRCVDLVGQSESDTPVLLDTGSDLAVVWGVRGLPTAIGISADGIVGDYRTAAQQDAAVLMRQLLAELAHQTPPTTTPTGRKRSPATT